MIVLSYNVRGCGSSVKRKCSRSSIQSVQVDVCFIQESKLSSLIQVDVRSLWMDAKVEWSAKWFVERSRGIITLWKPGLFELIISFMGEGFLGLCVLWQGTRVYLVIVY